jgi:hypothetical protein
MHRIHVQAGLTAIATAGAAVLLTFGMASAASASPAQKTQGPPPGNRSCSVSVQARVSGAFSNNQDILGSGVVPGSVYVLATQGPQGSNNPDVTGFGPGTGYTVSADWSAVTLQSPYAGSNDGFTTYYSVFVNPCHDALTTGTSGAFSNNQDVIQARDIVPGSVSVVATVGQTAGQDNPSVNNYQFGLKGYTVAYTPDGAIATLLSPFAGSNDGFTTYYTAYAPRVFRHNPSVLTARFLWGSSWQRHWSISNVRGGRDVVATYYTYVFWAHRWVRDGTVLVPAYGTAHVTTHDGSGGLLVRYQNGYGITEYAYAAP